MELQKIDTASPLLAAGSAPVAANKYISTPSGLARVVDKDGDPHQILLTNFCAKITADDVIDNGIDTRHEFEITADVRGITTVFRLTAEEYSRMNWVLPQLGANAIVHAGFGINDYVRAAIQSVSGDIPTRRVYEHLGWREIDGKWHFLHAGGTICSMTPNDHRAESAGSGITKANVKKDLGQVCPISPINQNAKAAASGEGILVRVPPVLKSYRLPEPLTGPALAGAIKKTILALSFLPKRLWLPLLGGIFRAALDKVDFSIMLVGQTNLGKTILASLCAHFFGQDLHDRNLPGSWLSTNNYLLATATLMKNVVFVIDDFVLTGSQSDMDRSQKDAERIFRAQGNQAGRGRAGRDGTPREASSPQGLIIATAEAVPEGHSLTSRMLILEIEKGDVLQHGQNARVTHAKQLGRDGVFAQVMSSFLSWVASAYAEHRADVQSQKAEFRNVFQQDGMLPRTIDIAADILAGFEVFLEFAASAGAVSAAEWEELWNDQHAALRDVLKTQSDHAKEADPVERFLTLFMAAMATGKAHLKGPFSDTEIPLSHPATWGWKMVDKNIEERNGDVTTFKNITTYIPQGQQIGWYENEQIYIEIDSCLAVLQRFAKDSSLRPMPLSSRTLGRTLDAKGIIGYKTKGHYTQRILVHGAYKRVLHIPRRNIVEFIGDESEKPSFLSLLD